MYFTNVIIITKSKNRKECTPTSLRYTANFIYSFYLNTFKANSNNTTNIQSDNKKQENNESKGQTDNNKKKTATRHFSDFL